MENLNKVNEALESIGFSRETAAGLAYIAHVERKPFAEFFGPIMENFITSWETHNETTAGREGYSMVDWTPESLEAHRVKSIEAKEINDKRVKI